MYEAAAILGAGSWGMAIARLLDKNGLSVRLWEHDPVAYNQLAEHRCQPDKLAGVTLNESIRITDNLHEGIDGARLIVLATPAQYLRSVLVRIKGRDLQAVGFVNLAKGIETGTLKRMSEVVQEELSVSPEQTVTLSGPSHAEEVVADMPTAVVAAGCSEDFLVQVQESFSNRSFRVYKSDDLIGVEMGGSLKNIIAIAAGIASGLGTGDNTLGALITRGLAEITRLGEAMGASARTFAGLSGIGDLVTTCASRHSRNRYVGERIGRGEKLVDILAGMTMSAEGVDTTRSGYALARRREVEMPITDEVYQVLFEGKPPAEAVDELMGRELKSEIWQ